MSDPQQPPAQGTPPPATPPSGENPYGVPPYAQPAPVLPPTGAPDPGATAAYPVAPSAPAAPAPPIPPPAGYQVHQTPQAAPAYPAAPGYQAPPGAYSGPVATGYDAPFVPAERRAAGGSGLGLTALLLSLAAAVGATIVVGWAAFEIGRGVVDVDNLSALDGPSLRFLTPVRDIVLWAEISAWAGTILGIVAFVLGIVATVRRRGRGMGITAIVLSALGPFVFGTVAFTLLTMGAAVGAAQLG